MRRVRIFFFNERHCLKTSFLVLSTPQVVYIRLKKVRFIASLFASWSKERRAIGARNRCRLKRVKIIFFLCDIVSLFSYIPRVRFGSRIWLRLRKSLKVGQTTTLCPAQDYVFHIFRKVLCLFVAGFSLDCNQGLCFQFLRFTIRNRQIECSEKYGTQTWMQTKLNWGIKLLDAKMLQGSPCLTENITPWYNFFLTFLITQIHLGRFVFYFRHIPLWNTNFQEISFFPGSYVARIPKSTLSEI